MVVKTKSIKTPGSLISFIDDSVFSFMYHFISSYLNLKTVGFQVTDRAFTTAVYSLSTFKLAT